MIPHSALSGWIPEHVPLRRFVAATKRQRRSALMPPPQPNICKRQHLVKAFHRLSRWCIDFHSPWSALPNGLAPGRCVVTIGTARGDSDALAANGLVPGHNYAISGACIDLILRPAIGSPVFVTDFRLGERKLTIVNPWRDSTGSERTGDFAKNLGASLPKGSTPLSSQCRPSANLDRAVAQIRFASPGTSSDRKSVV